MILSTPRNLLLPQRPPAFAAHAAVRRAVTQWRRRLGVLMSLLADAAGNILSLGGSPVDDTCGPGCPCGGCAWRVTATGTACSRITGSCFANGVTPLQLLVTLLVDPADDDSFKCPNCYPNCNGGGVCMVGGNRNAMNGTYTVTQVSACKFSYVTATGPITIRQYASFGCTDAVFTDYSEFHLDVDFAGGGLHPFVTAWVNVGGFPHYIVFWQVWDTGCANCTIVGAGGVPNSCLTIVTDVVITSA